MLLSKLKIASAFLVLIVTLSSAAGLIYSACASATERRAGR